MTETTIQHVCQTLAEIAPLRLAESWDNVGLLVGDRENSCSRVMTCLTITPPVVAEAIEREADMIVAHHPLPFKPLARLTTDTTAGKMLWELASARVSIYSAHTAFDSARAGINQQWAEAIRLSDIKPLVDSEQDDSLGSGRCGQLESGTLGDLIARVASFLKTSQVRYVGDPTSETIRVAVACGSGGSFLDAARRKGCDALITGESNFHGCLEAQSTGVGLILVGHYASERFAMEQLADRLAAENPDLTVWASAAESDPVATHSL